MDESPSWLWRHTWWHQRSIDRDHRYQVLSAPNSASVSRLKRHILRKAWTRDQGWRRTFNVYLWVCENLVENQFWCVLKKKIGCTTSLALIMLHLGFKKWQLWLGFILCDMAYWEFVYILRLLWKLDTLECNCIHLVTFLFVLN